MKIMQYAYIEAFRIRKLNLDEQFDPAGTCAGFDMEQLRLLLNNTGLSVHDPILYLFTHTSMHVFMLVADPGPRANITRKRTCVLSHAC